jgi:hypothetical protein
VFLAVIPFASVRRKISASVEEFENVEEFLKFFENVLEKKKKNSQFFFKKFWTVYFYYYFLNGLRSF